MRVFRSTLAALATLAALYGCVSLTEAERLAIAHDAIRIEVCQQKGRDCRTDRDGGPGCWDVYNACIVDAGLR